MNIGEYILALLCLIQRIFNHVRIHKRLTPSEKAEIVNTVFVLLGRALSSQPGKLIGELDVPRIQYKQLEHEST